MQLHTTDAHVKFARVRSHEFVRNSLHDFSTHTSRIQLTCSYRYRTLQLLFIGYLKMGNEASRAAGGQQGPPQQMQMSPGPQAPQTPSPSGAKPNLKQTPRDPLYHSEYHLRTVNVTCIGC